MSGSEPPGEILRRVRTTAGLSQRQLAELAGTTWSTISAYETGAKEPKLSTLDRILRAAGAEIRLTVDWTKAPVVALDAPVPDGMHPTAVRSLFIGRALAAKVRRHPREALELARDNLERWHEEHAGGRTDRWLHEWQSVLGRGGVQRILAILVGSDQESIDLRHTNPFAGLLSEQEREIALDEWKRWKRQLRAA